jgi:cell division cycle 20-like protein 1 (cofactor of APC complex)
MWYINTFYFAAIAWSLHHRGLLVICGVAADRRIHIWHSLTGQAVHHVNTGSQVSNVA